jgi:hypothetical protein
MKNFIINSFILREKNSLLDMYNYIFQRYNKSVKVQEIIPHLTTFVKNNIIFYQDTNYILTEKGNVVLNDHKYYYSKVIYNFFNNKNFQLKEVREEQQSMRRHLLANKEHTCIICDKRLPLCLLETAHLKPRCLLNAIEKNDKNVVEFMCRYCHSLYDKGFLAVKSDGTLRVSLLLNNYDLNYQNNKTIVSFNSYNQNYFLFHYNYIYKTGTEINVFKKMY